MDQLPYPSTITSDMIDTPPNAFALVNGSKTYPEISGIVKFYNTPYKGIIISAEFFHLPPYTPSNIPSFYGFHIHEKGDCSNNFANTGGHYNPLNVPHPYHAGDLPPLMSSDGYAWMYTFAKHLTLSDVIGRSVVVHGKADDFTSQPSGNSGDKIACGVIEEWHI